MKLKASSGCTHILQLTGPMVLLALRLIFLFSYSHFDPEALVVLRSPCRVTIYLFLLAGPGTVLSDAISYVFMFLSIATSNMVATSLAREV